MLQPVFPIPILLCLLLPSMLLFLGRGRSRPVRWQRGRWETQTTAPPTNVRAPGSLKFGRKPKRGLVEYVLCTSIVILYFITVNKLHFYLFLTYQQT